MTWTYTPGSSAPVDRVRFLIADTKDIRPIFQDEEIQDLLVMERNRVYAAAALALETMASDQAYVLKVVSHNGISTNGPSVSAELRNRAAVLRAKQKEIDDGDDEPGSSVLVIPSHRMMEPCCRNNVRRLH